MLISLSRKQMEDLFPHKEGLDYSKLQTTEEGSYSITRRRDAERIISVLKHNIPNITELDFTDATACIGGDTINLALLAKHVHSIEINESNFKALKNNVEKYELQNVTLYNSDAITTFNWHTDVLYVDPPWGGKNYRTHKNLDLYMSSKRLDDWLEQILLRKNRPAYIVLKVPFNYNFKRLNFLSNVDYICPFQIRSYVVIIITVHKPNLK